MKRVPLGGLVLAAATVLPLAAPATAQAARGVLWVTGQRYVNPHGCYNATRDPLTATNETDKSALIFQEPDCRGAHLGTLPPDRQRHILEDAQSIYIT